MLDWSQETLAEASGLSHKTIYNLERGFLSPSSSKEVKKALELKGFEFYEDSGLIRRANELKIYRGVNASNLFFEDLYSAVKDKGGEIAVICKSQEILAQSLGIENMHDLERFKKIGNYANLKCILSENGNALLSLPSAQFKVLPKYHTFMPFWLYLWWQIRNCRQGRYSWLSLRCHQFCQPSVGRLGWSSHRCGITPLLLLWLIIQTNVPKKYCPIPWAIFKTQILNDLLLNHFF